MLGCTRGTAMMTGLRLTAHLEDALYRKGQKETRERMDGIKLRPHAIHSDWIYTIRPRL
jgi:hypothetical protein